jgi:hypothetical protein
MIEVLGDDVVDHGLSQICYTLKDAQAAVFSMTGIDIRIWALDIARTDGTTGKCFYAATVVGLYAHLVGRTCHNYRWYEVISASHPVKFHLDVKVERVDASRYDNENLASSARKRLVEMGFIGEELRNLFSFCCRISGEDWSEEECVYATLFVKKALVAFFAGNFKQFNDNDKKIDPVILTGCRPSKFSLHILVDEMTLDRGYISCRYLAWEFARSLWTYIENGFQKFVVEGVGSSKLFYELFQI